MKKLKLLWGTLLASIIVGIFSSVAFVSAQEVAVQGYNTDQSLRRGMVVGLVDGDGTKVEAIANDRSDRLHGVVVDPNEAPFSLASDESKVFIATSGKYRALVSDVNGPIKAGDSVSMSNIEGIAQKVGDYQPLVLGKALQDFIPSEGSVVLSTTEDKSGNVISIGTILVDITVSRNPNQADPYKNIPDFLKKASDYVANKPVSVVRIYASLAVLFVFAGVSGSLIYSGVRSSITAMGRNPLSKKSITRSLIQIVLVAFIILIAGVFTVYLMLRL
ncbi:hypothetical protein KC878_03695 [Candidatus Saccharibacteria bacterium]|nr:hypothetical protein [Candidatus Saccharibacteria bacterium]